MWDPRRREKGAGEDGHGRPAGRASWAGTLVWIFLLLVSFLFAYRMLSDVGETLLDISYSSFVEQVAQDRVARVTIEGQRVVGEFSVAMQQRDDGTLAPVDAALDLPRSTTFQTTIPADISPELMPLLEQHGVRVEVVEQRDSIWPSLLLTLLPVVLIGGFIILMLRGAGGAGARGDVLNFGRSKVRVYDEKRPGVVFADVAGEDEAKADLQQVVDFLRDPARYHVMGARLPRGILLVGPPGTGKTLLAKAVAGEAGVPFFSVSGSEFVEMFVGVGASRVRDLFERAKAAAPSIIFVDELDAVGRQRFAGIGGGNDEREQTLNQVLVEMDGFETKDDVVVLAATNRPDVLDPALLRPGRFDRQVALGLPDRRAREAILRIHLRGIPASPEIDAARVAQATPGFAGADLANLVNEAALQAVARHGAQVEPSDIDAALDKIVLGNRRGMLISDVEKRLLAYHEAGHALVAAMTDGADPLRKISIVPRGQALGVTVQAPVEDRVTWTSHHLAGRLAILMGGRAAERLVFDDVSTGAQNDLKEATTLARRMVGLWGMSDDPGPYFIGLGEEHVFLGREITREGGDISDDLLQRAETSTQRLLNDAEATAARILARERPALDRLAERLIAEETLDAADIAAIIAAQPSAPEPALAAT